MTTSTPFIGRISIRPNDSGYANHCDVRRQGYRANIKFNDQPQFGVVTADSAAGMIVRLKTDDKGQYVYDAERQDIVDEVLHGKVEIEFAPERML